VGTNLRDYVVQALHHRSVAPNPHFKDTNREDDSPTHLAEIAWYLLQGSVPTAASMVVLKSQEEQNLTFREHLLCASALVGAHLSCLLLPTGPISR
jgi:hypothetical protein